MDCRDKPENDKLRELVPLKSPLQFEIGDAPVIFELFPFRRVDIVIDDIIAHRGAQ